MAKRKRYTYQDVKNIVENENYELISTEDEIIDEKGFVKTSTKITVWCKNENHNYIKPQLSKFLKGVDVENAEMIIKNLIINM